MLRDRSTGILALRYAALGVIISAWMATAPAAADWPFDGELPPIAAWYDDGFDWALPPSVFPYDEPGYFSGLFDPTIAAEPISLQPPEMMSSPDFDPMPSVDQVGYLYVESPSAATGASVYVPSTAAPTTQRIVVQPQSGPPQVNAMSPPWATSSQRAPAMVASRAFVQAAPTPAAPQVPSSRKGAQQGNSNAANTGTGAAAGKDDTTYGKKPEEPDPTQRREFLRTQSPLLKKGKWQFDVGLAYTLFEFDFPAIDANGTLVRGDLRRRTLVSPFAVRYGWSEKTQLFCNIPVGWRNTELATSPFTTNNSINDSSSYGGVGDITLGSTHLLRRGRQNLPDVVFTFSGGLPTGEKSVLSNATQGGLGTGFGSLAGQLVFIHTYDPFVLYWGGGYNHYFAGHIEGTPVQLGDQFSYQLGTGFAINDRVTLSSGLIGSYILGTTVNGQLIKNTQQEPLRFRSAVTLLRCKKIIEPFVEIGLTETSPAFRTGITWTF